MRKKNVNLADISQFLETAVMCSVALGKSSFLINFWVIFFAFYFLFCIFQRFNFQLSVFLKTLYYSKKNSSFARNLDSFADRFSVTFFSIFRCYFAHFFLFSFQFSIFNFQFSIFNFQFSIFRFLFSVSEISAQRSGAWRGCELRNWLFSFKDKISCEK